MSGPARKSRITEMHWSYSRRQQASCESKLRRPVQCWQHLAQELPARGKEGLSYVAENTPDPVKDIAETAFKAHYREDGSIKQGSKIHGFCLGIPYKVLLVVGGLLGFIITGITVSIQF